MVRCAGWRIDGLGEGGCGRNRTPLPGGNRQGREEMRPLFLINEVVMNQATRAMGKNLNWPGVVLEDDITLRTRKV